MFMFVCVLDSDVRAINEVEVRQGKTKQDCVWSLEELARVFELSVINEAVTISQAIANALNA